MLYSNMLRKLFANSRFWILISGIVVSVLIAGFVQLLIPSGSLQAIRTQQIYGFVSLALLFLALLASPLTKTFPNIPLKEEYLHARRAIGVLTFYYAFLHSSLAFFKQLGGFGGVRYYNTEYSWSLSLGVLALAVLFIMAATSLDKAVNLLSFKRWKLLHRLVYIAGVAVLVHVALIGSHYEGFGLQSGLTGLMVLILLGFQVVRIRRIYLAHKTGKTK